MITSKVVKVLAKDRIVISKVGKDIYKFTGFVSLCIRAIHKDRRAISKDTEFVSKYIMFIHKVGMVMSKYIRVISEK